METKIVYCENRPYQDDNQELKSDYTQTNNLLKEGWKLDPRFGAGKGTIALESGVVYHLVKFKDFKEEFDFTRGLALDELKLKFLVEQEFSKWRANQPQPILLSSGSEVEAFKVVEIIPSKGNGNSDSDVEVKRLLGLGWKIDECERFCSKSTKYIVIYKEREKAPQPPSSPETNVSSVIEPPSVESRSTSCSTDSGVTQEKSSETTSQTQYGKLENMNPSMGGD